MPGHVLLNKTVNMTYEEVVVYPGGTASFLYEFTDTGPYATSYGGSTVTMASGTITNRAHAESSYTANSTHQVGLTAPNGNPGLRINNVGGSAWLRIFDVVTFTDAAYMTLWFRLSPDLVNNAVPGTRFNIIDMNGSGNASSLELSPMPGDNSFRFESGAEGAESFHTIAKETWLNPTLLTVRQTYASGPNQTTSSLLINGQHIHTKVSGGRDELCNFNTGSALMLMKSGILAGGASGTLWCEFNSLALVTGVAPPDAFFLNLYNTYKNA